MVVWNDLLPAQRVSVFESGVDLAESDLTRGEQRRRQVSYRIGSMVAPALARARGAERRAGGLGRRDPHRPPADDRWPRGAAGAARARGGAGVAARRRRPCRCVPGAGGRVIAVAGPRPLVPLHRSARAARAAARRDPRRLESHPARRRVHQRGGGGGFEYEFAAAARWRTAWRVSTGTDALVLALRALGIGPRRPRDRPREHVLRHGGGGQPRRRRAGAGRLRPADQDDLGRGGRSGSCAPRGAAGVIAVHLYGHPADVDALDAVAAAYGAWVIEDAARPISPAPAARASAASAGSACFSFYPSKNLGAPGEGGAVTTNDPELADAIRDAAPSRAAGAQPPRADRLQRAARRAHRRGAARQAAASAGLDARAPAGGRAATRRPRWRRAIRLPYTAPWAEPVVAPLRDRGRRTATPCARGCRSWASRPACTTRRRSICNPRTRISGTAEAPSRGRAQRRSRCSRFRCSPSSPTRRSIGSSRHCERPRRRSR